MVIPVSVVTSAGVAGPGVIERTVVRAPRQVRVSSVGAATLLLTGVIHLIVAIAHGPGAAGGHQMLAPTSWDHWASAIVLALIGVAQIFVGAGLWVSPTPQVAVVGITLNVATLLLYIASRTTGLPFGATAWQSEAVGLLDLSVAVLEIAGIVALTACLPTSLRSRVTTILMTVGVAMFGARLVVVGLG